MTSKLVKKTAKELAGAFYDGEDALRDGRVGRTTTFREAGMTQAQFIREFWPDFVKIARKTLAHILTLPGTSEAEKNQIYDALLEERGAMTDEQLAAPSIIRLN